MNLNSIQLASVPTGTLETLFDASNDVTFFVKDLQGRYVAVNRTLVTRYGYTQKSQVIGKRSCEICPGEFGERPSQQDLTVIQTGHPLIDFLEMHWHAPFEPVWCLTTKLPLLDECGIVVGLIGISRDVRAFVRPEEIPQSVADALRHFEKHLDEPTTPTTLAQSANMTSSQFCRMMKRLFGMTPGQYIIQARIAEATHLLRNSDRSVAEVAYSCGHSDQSSFARVFRSVTGATPSEFRHVVQTAVVRKTTTTRRNLTRVIQR